MGLPNIQDRGKLIPLDLQNVRIISEVGGYAHFNLNRIYKVNGKSEARFKKVIEYEM